MLDHTAAPDDAEVREGLKNISQYVEQLLAMRDKVVLDISEYPACLTERDLRGEEGKPLPGVSFNQADDTWLSFERLSEQTPPPPPPDLAPWLQPEPDPTPGRPPCLVAERTEAVSAEVASELVEAGLVDPAAVAPLATAAGEPATWAVWLRPADLPDVTQALAAYRGGPWQDWAQQEVPRRRAIALYERLYKAQAELASAGEDGRGELVVGIGLARWQVRDLTLRVPLIEQRAEFELDPSNGRLSILPRNVPPVATLAAFQRLEIAEAAVLQRDMTARLAAVARDPDLPFGPFHPPSFLGVLEACAARLDASGCVAAGDDGTEPATAALRISPGFCLIIRRRGDDFVREDLRRLIQRVMHDPLPETARRLVVGPPDALPDGGLDAAGLSRAMQAPVDDRGSLDWPAMRAPETLYFPLPANHEQTEIARQLDRDGVHGVVVQGPPGTGKTHTIANIIGHCMARGQRVLVAAHTAEALAAIRDKLPPALRDLAIAVTHSDRAGARQLEEAVLALSDRVQSLDIRHTTERVDGLLRGIQRTDAELAEIDTALAAIARANETDTPWRGGAARPQDIAAWVATQGGQHDWFPDRLDLTPEYARRFDDAVIAEARQLRRRLGADLCQRPDELLAATAMLPTLGAIVASHRVLRDGRRRSDAALDYRLPKPDLAVAQPGELSGMRDWLERLAAWRDSCADQPWLREAWAQLASGQPAERFGLADTIARLQQAARLAEQAEALAREVLVLPEIAAADRLGEALGLLAAGRRPFGVLDALRQKPARAAIAAARIAGEVPADAAAWQQLASLHAWRREIRRFVVQWNEFASRRGLPPLPDPPEAARAAVQALGRQAATMLALLAQAPRQTERLGVLFPYGLDAAQVVQRIDTAEAVAAIRAAAADAALAAARRVTETLRLAAGRIGGELGDALREWADGLGGPAFDEANVAEAWRGVQAEVDRLLGLRGDLTRLAELAAAVRHSGAPRWAELIQTQPATDPDRVLPANWGDAWDHAQAVGLLARVADRAASQRLASRRAALVLLRERRFLEVIELRTYLTLRSRLTETVMAAIRKFLSALARLPKSAEAKSAARQRRILRDSLQVAARAIPCWIMPEWRVAEQLPAELGSFDLVIIDEASQSNITALPVLLRGKKLLVVGDDRQVSPSAVGIEEAAIHRLRVAHLRGQPLEYQLDPATSLYELAGMVFPGKVIMLREHFRSVEPIIRFSARFYNNTLLPLRLPKPSERIDPPLVDILVEDGRRRGEVNPAEADVVVREVQLLIAQAGLHAAGRRSIGVISLHGGRQGKLIYDRLLAAIGPRAMTDHRIMCGDAATFQGQERDIVLLSMVHDERTARRETMRMFEQRYNVALSRARDRMVLVRSVTESMLKEGDIKLAVLRHFQDPMAGGVLRPGSDLLDACDSEFEREVGARLVAAGYRLRAQVAAGGYRIDFVVEGANDTRLAIELDGDSFHGPGRWAEDMRRQQALERVGWVFWRCWASEWFAHREAVFQDLVAALDRRGVQPIGAASTGAGLVEFRRVRHDPAVSALPAGAAAASDERTVRPGDTVVVRYASEPARVRTLQIVADGSADGRDRIAPSSPLAAALLGLRVEEETEITVNGKPVSVLVADIRAAA